MHKKCKYFLYFTVIAAFLLCLAGCRVGPDYVRPELEMPNAWHIRAVEGLQDGSAPLETWWLAFNDPILTDLIRQARDGNLDLKTAYARIGEFRARLGVAAGKYWPTVDAAASYSRSKASEAEGVALNTDETSFYSNRVDASWEFDLFGRIGRSVESSKASMEVSLEDYRDVLVSLYSQVAQNYIHLRTQQTRIRYAKENIVAQEKILELTQKRLQAGLVPELDVQQAKLILDSTRSSIPLLYQEEIQTIYRLSVLLGKHPGTLISTLSVGSDIPDLPDQITIGLPVELLRQRPDVRSAERVLAAQTAEIGVATAALYPSFSLSGTFALEAIHADEAGNWDSRAWGFGPTVRWNLFDGNRIRNNITVREFLAEQAMINYEQTVLLALEEVENALIAFEQEKIRLQTIQRAVASAQKSVDLVTELYQKGLTDFQNVLDMQRTLVAQQDLMANSEGAVANNLVRIYKALGGGWSFNRDNILHESQSIRTETNEN
ncbi:MAG: efflux transporter outer membrane subunit [Phycisphaerae bacterium]